MVFVSRDETTKAQQPREEPLHIPSATVTSELAKVLGHLSAVALVGSDHLHPQLRQLCIKRVAVLGPVTDDAFR